MDKPWKNRGAFFSVDREDSIDGSGVVEWFEDKLGELMDDKIDTITIHAKVGKGKGNAKI